MRMNPETKDYLIALVKFLWLHDKLISLQQLIEHLDGNGLTKYDGPRGIARAVSTLHNELQSSGRGRDADILATSIVGKDGRPAREKYD